VPDSWTRTQFLELAGIGRWDAMGLLKARNLEIWEEIAC
jgi:hypothetical protein